jgi:hypothetical protein
MAIVLTVTEPVCEVGDIIRKAPVAEAVVKPPVAQIEAPGPKAVIFTAGATVKGTAKVCEAHV